ncbi:MAG: ABC transporter permease [Hyphomicrobiales bacterium]
MRALTAALRRVVYALVLILVVIVFNFTLIHLAPGDPADVIAGEMGGASPELMAQIRHSYGLDQSFLAQLWIYLGKALQGDLGRSYYFNSPVISLVLQRVPATLLLVVTALTAAIVGGTLLGVVASRRPNGIVSHIVTILGLVGFSAPVFWTGIVLILIFASAIPIFPVGDMYDVTKAGGSFAARTLDVAHHLILPAVTLAIVYLAQYSRLARAAMLEVLNADYVRTARAKGLPERLVIFKHALRNAMLPIVTIAGLQFSQVFAGAVLVEAVFNWPGLGRLAYESILRRDTPTLLGILLGAAVIVIVVNVLTDLSYRIIDPRIRMS